METRDVSFDYRGVLALNRINLQLYSGEMHSLVGEHGAGKSTLGALISGYIRPQTGEILFRGQPLTSHSVISARRLGIHMVHQQPQLNENVTVAENLYYGDDDRAFSLLYDRRKVEAKAEKILADFGFVLDPRVRVRRLSLSDRTALDIIKNLIIKPRLLILDEALERVSSEAFDRIVFVLRELMAEGVTILAITHRIDDVFAYSNRVTVLKDGVQLLTTGIDHVSKLNLIRMAYTQVGDDRSRTEMNEAFQQYLRYNDAILQRLPVNIIVVDPLLRIKLVNESCRATFNLERTVPPNVTLSSLLHGRAEIVRSIESAVRRERPQAFYHVELTINGIRSINNVKISPIRDGLIVIGTVIIIEDVTEHDELQRQLILSEKLASVGLLAAGVAHEINNPLEIISNYLSYMKYRQSAGEIPEFVEKVKAEIEYISNIVGNLVSFSSPNVRSVETVSLRKTIGDILNLLKFNSEYQHIETVFEDADEGLVLGERDEMKQVVLNLIKNSLEAMPDGGRILIALSRDTPSDRVTLRFSDTGPGIDADDPNSVFMPFYSTKKDRPGSLGLGLSISYRIIERSGGTMRVENVETGGCLFTIELPGGTEDESNAAE